MSGHACLNPCKKKCLETCRWEGIADRSDTQCSAPFMPLDEWAECDAFAPATTVMETYQGRIL